MWLKLLIAEKLISLVFLKNFISHFYHTGALLPSSRYLARVITERIESGDSPISILEVGAGTGSFTREIISKLKAGDKFVIYEINSEFCEILKKKYYQ